MIKFLTAGESHGPKITAILEGIPAGFKISKNKINFDLAQRQKGFGASARMKIERDQVKITSGIINNLTTGGPICFEIKNLDYSRWENKTIKPMTTPRPGHADLTGAVKFQHKDLRLSLERASARETAMRVCVGAVCKQILENFNIQILGHVVQVGEFICFGKGLPSSQTAKSTARSDVQPNNQGSTNNHSCLDSALSADPASRDLDAIRNDIKSSQFSITAPELEPALKDYIYNVMKGKNTLGGIFEVIAFNCPIGLGSYTQWDKRLDALLAQSLMSIPAMKGVEIGPAFENSKKLGTEIHDSIFLDNLEGDKKALHRKTNNAGGIEGGISNGEPIVARVAMKPISTTLRSLPSVNLATGEPENYAYERSDFCALPRAVVIGEAMVAITICDLFLQKFGSDNYTEIKNNFHINSKHKGQLSSFELNNQPWSMTY